MAYASCLLPATALTRAPLVPDALPLVPDTLIVPVIPRPANAELAQRLNQRCVHPVITQPQIRVFAAIQGLSRSTRTGTTPARIMLISRAAWADKSIIRPLA